MLNERKTMKRKIKILHVQITDNYGGIESLLTNIYSDIDRKKFQFDFITTAKKPYQDKLKSLGANIYLMPSIKNTVLYIKTFDHVLDNNYDIVHFHKNSAANIIPILLAKHHSSHPKIIIHSHNTSPSVNNAALTFLHQSNRWLVNLMADKKVACSNVAAKWMFGTLNNVQIINNGIDINKFTYSGQDRDLIREKLGISPSDLVLGNVGRFSEQKNQSFLIDIFGEVKKAVPNSRLILVGDGLLLDKVKQKAKKLGLTSNINFVGKQSDIPAYLSAMDAFVMPSLYEGLPISAVEAQSEGLDVFLANTISKEVVLTKNVKMFSLDERPKEIAGMILKNIKFNDRKNDAITVKNSNYGLNTTIKKFIDLYQGL